jgi:phosphate transport system permease protein
MRHFRQWIKEGTPWVWMIAGSVSVSLFMVFGILALITVRGLGYFWPSDIVQVDYQPPGMQAERMIGEIYGREDVPTSRLGAQAKELPDLARVERLLLKVGNRDTFGADFHWVIRPFITQESRPDELMVVERREWGNVYGRLVAVREAGKTVAEGDSAWAQFQARIDRVSNISQRISHIHKGEIGAVNYRMEQLRLKQRRLELNDSWTAQDAEEADRAREALHQRYAALETELATLQGDIQRDSYTVVLMDGRQVEYPVAKVVRAFRPNAMDVFAKLRHYGLKVWEFVSDDPRESNTEGGIFPAIFGTVLMVMLMAVIVTPLGVVAAVYLHEYAKQGWVTRLIRVAVNNLAGVPSVVYGLFGLGFFVYFLGGNIDRLFFPEALPSPTFGTGGILWSAVTLSLLTLPVVIVATEEGLSRIPRAIREGSLALGATKIETLWRTVVPMASPAIMTGLILAVARAAGEVAPLMLVGVVKLAPSLPLDENAPFLHLDRKFMHLGFHIFDVGFQSPNVEAARPLVYATAFLLVVIILTLNLAAIGLRNRLRERYRNLET